MSLNDPQWGKRGRSGPPDLDEIWRNVNRRLNEMFGRTTPARRRRAAPPFAADRGRRPARARWSFSSGWRAVSTSSTKGGAAS